MIALMLRPCDYRSSTPDDHRVKLTSTAQTQEWLPIIKALPESIRTYMTTLISANRVLFYNAYGHWLFPQKPKGDDGEVSDEGSNFGWWGAMLDVAEDGVFGTYEQVLDTPHHTVCQHMIRKIDAARRSKQEHDHMLASMSR